MPTDHSKAQGSLTADPVHYSTNMPKLLKNLYNEPVEKARGRFVGIDRPMRQDCAMRIEPESSCK
jgi:hypothetical protein